MILNSNTSASPIHMPGFDKHAFHWHLPLVSAVPSVDLELANSTHTLRCLI